MQVSCSRLHQISIQKLSPRAAEALLLVGRDIYVKQRVTTYSDEVPCY